MATPAVRDATHLLTELVVQITGPPDAVESRACGIRIAAVGGLRHPPADSFECKRRLDDALARQWQHGGDRSLALQAGRVIDHRLHLRLDDLGPQRTKADTEHVNRGLARAQEIDIAGFR